MDDRGAPPCRHDAGDGHDPAEEALAALDEREQLILTLYYQHEMSLKEIALVLDLTEARVCQLNKKIAQKIQSFFQK